ncbi:hypothetical protein BHU72_07545 [Desulfuribacillus stibiiarsenatis]|uniref:Helix-turn-helix type 11 domain-containing protein n=1 Tax=Desulfuribacillus stibiiarsenatis TaxID=1390249 RepID=A0A1E5L3L8_9FIRM|nr:hypothetical protein [Desulfuribacillus stibiiarsenatis]OEH84684.1 hypothetical protein BHU72_07545 [Desulfuribacillus stibiiarsenatis]
MLSKTARQLIIYHVFRFTKSVSIRDIRLYISIKNKTAYRDIKDLNNAGLLQTIFSKKDQCYVHHKSTYDDSEQFYDPKYTENQAYNRHLDKLRRLGRIMNRLHYNTLSYSDCLNWYQKAFPGVSTRTMQRDFKELTSIGYTIIYDRFEKCYYINFPRFEDDIRQWK